MTPQMLSPQDVLAQRERLLASRFFRGPKLRQLLNILVDEWFKDGGKQLTERCIGELVGEPITFEAHANKLGYPRTRANLGHVRSRLKKFHETEGYRDRVIIKLNPGSYALVVAYNPVSTAIPDIDPSTARLILRAKAAIDKRTVRGAIQAIEYGRQIPYDWNKPRQIATVLFLKYAAAPLLPSLTYFALPEDQTVINDIKSSGLEPWECTFAEACIEACCRHEWRKALGLFESVIVRNSLGEAKYLWWYTALLACLDKGEEAISILDAAVRHFSRTNLAMRADLADLQTLAGRFEDAAEILLSSLDFASPNNPRYLFSNLLFLEAQDRLEEAVAALDSYCDSYDSNLLFQKAQPLLTAPPTFASLEPVLALNEGHLFLPGLQVLILGRTKGPEFVADLVVDFQNLPYGIVPSVDMAIAMIGLNRLDDAVSYLRKAAFVDNDPYSMWFHIFPPLRHLKGHSGYQELLKDLKLSLQRER
jgi:tetratricopeptide (TPR) repeat protein